MSAANIQMQNEFKLFAVIPAGSLNVLMRIIGLMFAATTTFATTAYEDGNDVEWAVTAR
jgi:hypothetical protein